MLEPKMKLLRKKSEYCMAKERLLIIVDVQCSEHVTILLVKQTCQGKVSHSLGLPFQLQVFPPTVEAYPTCS